MIKPSVLILCTGNSCRSHMAEGIFCEAAGDWLEAHSAGSSRARYLHPKAIEVRRDYFCCLQVGVADEVDHRLTAGKLADIIGRAAAISLGTRHTDCLAKESCLPAQPGEDRCAESDCC